MHLFEALAWGCQELQNESETAKLDAEVLLAELLQLSRSQLIVYAERFITRSEWSHYQQWIVRRKRGEPLAYLVGHKEFWSLDLCVTPDTLVPRPETELLVELALALFPQDSSPRRIADLGTGCGAIALALGQERPSFEVYATDQSAAALDVARKNAAHLQLTTIQFFQGSWCSALPSLPFDAILSNPPYLSEKEWQFAERELHFEPAAALVSREEGLRDISDVIHGAKRYLRAGGYLLLEHGWKQGAAVRSYLQQEQYSDVRSYCDLAGRERVSGGRWTK